MDVVRTGAVDDLAVLRAAKELIAERDRWIRGDLYDGEGRMCVAGAIAQAHDTRSDRERHDSYESLRPYLRMNRAAEDLYGAIDIVFVNDRYGFDAVHHCFEIAIKQAEAELDA